MENSVRFPDIVNHWARPFIEGLAARKIVSGFPDGTFKPDQPTTRAQFAALLTAIFRTSVNRSYVPFIDVPERHWAAKAIQKAYETGYLSGYPGRRFRPEASIARVEALVSLASGLGVAPEGVANALAVLSDIYQDADQIPAYATKMVAAATAAGIVVNAPEIEKLRPTEVATRADIAAFFYQALEYGNKVAPVSSEYIVVQQRNVAVSHQREFRGVWLTTIWNKGWPSRKDMSVEEQKSELSQMLDLVQDLRINALLWQVRPTGDALYPSELEPWSEWFTGVEGQAPEPFYDPLELIIRECHQRGIEFHAWFTRYRARVTSQKSPNVSPHLAVTNPEVVPTYGTFLWMDPGSKVVQDHTYEVIMDVVSRYDVDGIHLDDYCYPYPGAGAGEDFPDQQTYTAYLESFPVTEEEESDGDEIVEVQLSNGEVEGEVIDEGENEEEPSPQPQPLSLAAWRRDNVSKLVKRIAEGIKAVKPQVKFGISPFGIQQSGEPEGIRGFNQYDGIYADPQQWLTEGWVDYLTPQLYWAVEPPAQSYPVLLQWWTEQNTQQRHIYPGNALYKFVTESWSAQEYKEQVNITRQLSLGNIFYDMRVFIRNPQLVEFFQTAVYPEPALAPTMTWLVNQDQPDNPARVRGRENKLTWWLQTDAQADIRAWTIYKQQGDIWQLHQIVNADTTAVDVELGVYALCAVDRMNQESIGILASVGATSNRLK